MLEFIVFGLVGAGVLAGYAYARRFVRDRLRFVDAVYRRRAPWLAGGVAAVLALPVAWILPVVGPASAVVFGAAVGLGVSRGARDLKRLPGAPRG